MKTINSSENKVINIVSRTTQDELPFDSQSSKDILNYLMQYKQLIRSTMTYGEHVIMRDLIKFLENNSGVNTNDMVQERNAQ